MINTLFSKHKLSIIAMLLIAVLIAACSSNSSGMGNSSGNRTTPAAASTQSVEYKLFWSASVPGEWKAELAGMELTNDKSESNLSVSISDANSNQVNYGTFKRIYAIGAPFPTITDEISFTQLQAIWKGNPAAGSEFSRLYMTDATLKTFTELWGAPDTSSISVVAKDDLVTALWELKDALAIVPFEEIEPKLKILKIDGLSPIDRPLDEEKYPLTVTYSLNGDDTADPAFQGYVDQLIKSIPATNRDESKMTVIIMTGTTAITRVTTTKVEINGYEYPGSLVKKWFDGADIKHVSNEVSFWEDCPDLSPVTMRFCSKADQIKVLEYLGVNVVESTGNHLNDYGTENFVKTLEMYKERGWLNYGGGVNQAAAQEPITLTSNGNKIAFIGCNTVGFATGWAKEDAPGAAHCVPDYFSEQISQLKADGYVVIATYQFQEADVYMYDEYYRKDFKNAAAAGADIVQGSQAHTPMGFDFVGNTIIHYGLGNFIFDQMEPINIRGFVDRHIVYDGKYISTELLTTKMMNWSRPTPMTEEERSQLLSDVFKASRLR